MTNSTPHLSSEEPQDVLQRAESALHSRGVGATPPVAVLESTLRALQAAAPLHSPTRRFWTMKKIFSTSLGGALAAGVASLLFYTVFQQNTRVAFSEVLDNVRQVQSVKMKMHSTMQSVGETRSADGIIYIDEPSRRLRYEFNYPTGTVVEIFDLKAGTGVLLMPYAKTATRLDLAHIPAAKAPHDFLAQLKNLEQTSTKDLGEKEIDGKKVHGFFAVVTNDQTTIDTTIWADDKTKMPLVVTRTIHNGFIPATTTASDFQWNAPIDEALLNTDIPDGYAINNAPVDMGKASETDVAVALKAATAFNNGKFPKGLTMTTLGQSLYLSLSDKSQIEQKMHEQSANLIILARGWAFITDPQNGTDWHWAGQDVAFGEKDRPILWYKPAGKSTYNVFNADLSIHHDSPEPTLPSTLLDTAAATQPIN